MKEVSWTTPIEKAEFVFKREFMMMEHNYLCAVCKQDSAVQDTHTGVLQPCWDCQAKGYHLKQRKMPWWFRLIWKSSDDSSPKKAGS